MYRNYHIAFTVDDLKSALKKYKHNQNLFVNQPLTNEIVEALSKKPNLLYVFANNMNLIQPIEDFAN